MQDFWERFRLDPRVPANAGLRASDADREVVSTQLAEAYADGRITRDEYDERISAVLAGVTLSDLPPLVADLVPTSSTPARPPTPLSPADVTQRAADAWRRKVRDDVGVLILVAVIVWTVWLATGHHFPWPIFPTAGVGLNAVITVLNREEIVAKETRRLERERAKQLERRPEPEEEA